MNSSNSALSIIRQNANEILDNPQDFDNLIDEIGDCRFVLLGEATHGTHEFYEARAQITIRLIEEKGFSAVAVEADWTDAYRVNRYIRSLGDDLDPMIALNDFTRFPRWLWRNTDVADFISILKYFNQDKPPERQVGFYGLDLYSLYSSIDKIISYLDEVDPQAAQKARQRYSCFEQVGQKTQNYSKNMQYVTESCIRQAVKQLEELRLNGINYVKKNGFVFEEEQFFAEQNAKLACDAEIYYKTMFSEQLISWNLRDKFMTDTLEALVNHISKYREPKIVAWLHNSHSGDARATQVSGYGEFNVGQLIRERYNEDAFLVGFFTHMGTVSAASFWDGPVEKKLVNPSIAESYEHLFHRSEIPSFYLIFRNNKQLSFLEDPLQERSIGVIYNPMTERQSNYYSASLVKQFDAIIHFDQTIAVQPLDRSSGGEKEGELPETFQSGL